MCPTVAISSPPENGAFSRLDPFAKQRTKP